MGQPWTSAQKAMLRRDYATTPNKELGRRLNRRPGTVAKQAWAMGLRKTVRDTWTRGGGLPEGWGNWGFKFSAGNAPANRKPIGSESVRKGRVYVKVSNTGHGNTDWRPKQEVVWTRANGPLPDGFVVAFRNGNKMDFNLENLEAISLAERMERNSIHNLPAELVDLYQTRGLLNREINKRNRNG